jgi:hypothetical protein
VGAAIIRWHMFEWSWSFEGLKKEKYQVVQQLRERIDKWNYMKLKSFCTTKEMVSK